MATKTDQEKRPECVTEAHLEFLDDLRESGVTNMFGAAPFLDNNFPELREGDDSFRASSVHRPSSKKAHEILQYWMDSFGNPNR